MIKDRSIQLEGAHNVRDLGGVHTVDGREITAGKLFRADALHKLTEADLEVLAPLDIATVMDFRSASEIEQTGKARLVERGAQYINLPLSDRDPARPTDIEMPETLGHSYQSLAHNRAHLFAEAINKLANPDQMPAVFHCAGGKDRAGITAAMLYVMLGVDRETIIADYVLTDSALERMWASWPTDQVEAIRAKYAPSFLRAEVESITMFFGTLDAEFEGPENWLRQAGVKDESFENLREAMLV